MVDNHHDRIANQALASRVLQGVVVLHRTARTHAMNNDAMLVPLQGLADALNAVRKENGSCEFLLSGTMSVTNGIIAVPDLNQLAMVRTVSQDLRSRDVGGFRVFGAADPHIVRNLITAVFSGASGASTSGDFDVLRAAPIEAMLRQLHSQEVTTIKARDPAERALSLYAALISVVQRAIESARGGGQLGVGASATRVLREVIDAGVTVPHILLMLAFLRDDSVPYLPRHLAGTTILSVLVALEMRLPRSELLHIASVALLHEAGTAVHGGHLEGVVGALSAQDRQLVRDLPLLSARMFLRRASVDHDALRAVVAAVECKRPYDQPVDAASGLSVPLSTIDVSAPRRTMLSARIIQACSTLDALMSARSFRAALSIPEALAKIQAGDPRLDPVVMKALTEVVCDPRRLVGSAVRKSPVARIKLARRAVAPPVTP